MAIFQVKLLVVLGTLFFTMASTQDLPEPDKLYVIQSTMDGGVWVFLIEWACVKNPFYSFFIHEVKDMFVRG